MHVLVTGGAGRVGRRLIGDLLARGDAVTSFDLAESPLQHPRLRHVTGTFDDPAASSTAVEGADVVVHAGAYMSWLASDMRRLHEANVTGTFVLLRAAAQAKVRRFVFASSGEVYPETAPIFMPITEDHPTQPRSVYGLTKLLGEKMVAFFARTTGMETVVLRFSHTQDAAELLDPDSFFSGPRFYLRARIRQQASFGNQAIVEALKPHDDGTEKLLISRGIDGTVFRMPITDTRDIVAGVIAAVDSPNAVGRTLNLGTEEAIAFDVAVAHLQAVTGLPAVDVRLPIPAVDYVTCRKAAIEVLGLRPSWTFAAMVEDAAWTARLNAGGSAG
jgi:UDP-glucose 4-epimerase